MRTFKGMYKANDNTRSVQHRVADILFRYWNTPHSTTGKTPAELFLKREPPDTPVPGQTKLKMPCRK